VVGGDEKGLCRGGEKRGKGGQGADGALDGGRSAERGEEEKEERGASQRVAVGPSALSIVLLLSCSRSFSLALRWHDRRVMSVYTELELPPFKKNTSVPGLDMHSQSLVKQHVIQPFLTRILPGSVSFCPPFTLVGSVRVTL
jgi:hypothetical protein